jgi:citrate lyase beta subunit
MALVTQAIESRPDVIIVDLEDGVPADHKELARLGLPHVVKQVRAAGIGVTVRVNGTDTEWFESDVAAALDVGADAILLPKAGVASLGELAELMASQAQIWALVEQTADVLAVDQIASLASVDALTIGYGDLCKQLDLPVGSEHPEFDGVRRLVAAAASANHLFALDGVFVGAPDRVEEACDRSRVAGFAGRTLYRSDHVDGCHAAFSATF